jgi:hypothetical protein
VHLIVYDMGLTPQQRAELDSWDVQVRMFEYERFPPHVSWRDERSTYAFKALIMNDVMEEWECSL